MKNWMRFLFWCLLFIGVALILFFEHKKESNSPLNDPDIKITVQGIDTFLTKKEVLNRLKTHQVFEKGKEVVSLNIFKTEAALDTMP